MKICYFKEKFTKMTQINYVIIRVTHIFQKYYNAFLVENTLARSYNIFKKIIMSNNKFVYKIWLKYMKF